MDFCEMGFGWEIVKMLMLKMHVVRVLRKTVAVKVAWDIGAVPNKDLSVGLDWLEEEDSVAGEDAVGGRGCRLCRHLGNGEAVTLEPICWKGAIDG
jgi:hypothetical protein